MKRYYFILLFALLAFVAPKQSFSQDSEPLQKELVAPNSGKELKPTATQLPTQPSLTPDGRIAPTPSNTISPAGKNDPDLAETVGLIQELIKSWKTPINTIADFDWLLGVIFMILTYVVTRLINTSTSVF